MANHRGSKLLLIVAALFLVAGVVRVEHASAASPCKKNCKGQKKTCLSGFNTEYKAAKGVCKATKSADNADCKAVKSAATADRKATKSAGNADCEAVKSAATAECTVTGEAAVSACGSDKQCLKGTKKTFKLCKKTLKKNHKTCKKSVNTTDKAWKKQVKKDYNACKKQAKSNDKACKKDASAQKKRGKAACKGGFTTCNTCCKSGFDDCPKTNCGDGVQVPGEECDDANTVSGDCCSSTCQIETGCKCTGSPSVCFPACGDGIADPGEQCDPPGDPSAGCGENAKCDESCQCVQTADPCGNGVLDSGEECDPAEDVDRCAEGEYCTSSCVCDVCDCCALAPKYVESTVFPGSGICGSLSSNRCSNKQDAACEDDTQCDFGTCLLGPNFCWNGSAAGPACSTDGDCKGTCQDFPVGNLPMDLECGGLYTGGGNNAVPLPFELPDTNKVLLKVLSCNSTTGELALGAVTQAEKDIFTCSEGRKCSPGSDNPGDPCVLKDDCPNGSCQDRCLFGAPLPVPNEPTPATSVCAVNVVEKDATGTGTCGGDSELSAALRSVIYLNGDLLQSSKPPNVPGIQSCPLCVKQCLSGSKKNFPCEGNGDCPGSTCDAVTRCLGGPDTGFECEPMTSDLGDAFPTSHDCQNDPLQDITESIGGLPVDFAMTTGSLTDTMPQQAEDRTNGARVFCGFCRDVSGVGSLCFEGDKKANCPNTSSSTCQPQGGGGDISGCGNAVPCDSDADCIDGDEYESCVQRNPGAFGEAAATKISMQGTPAGCLADGKVKTVTSVGTFCIPPTFNDTVDAAGDLPGPGGVSLQAETQLVP